MSLLVDVRNELELLDARILGESHMQAREGVVLIPSRLPGQPLQLRLDLYRRFDIGKNDCSISPVVQPDMLDLGGANELRAEFPEPGLVVQEEEPALGDRETAGCMHRGSHSLNNFVGREGIAPSHLGYEWETRGLIFGPLLVDNLEEELCFVCMLEDNTTVSGFFFLIDAKADAVLSPPS